MERIREYQKIEIISNINNQKTTVYSQCQIKKKNIYQELKKSKVQI